MLSPVCFQFHPVLRWSELPITERLQELHGSGEFHGLPRRQLLLVPASRRWICRRPALRVALGNIEEHAGQLHLVTGKWNWTPASWFSPSSVDERCGCSPNGVEIPRTARGSSDPDAAAPGASLQRGVDPVDTNRPRAVAATRVSAPYGRTPPPALSHRRERSLVVDPGACYRAGTGRVTNAAHRSISPRRWSNRSLRA